LKKPNASVASNLSIIAFAVGSPGSFKQYGGVGQHPVGTGPYKFVEVHGDHVILEANPNFFRNRSARILVAIRSSEFDNS
jgi:peptide/nickel transport system substrate-binding protein